MSSRIFVMTHKHFAKPQDEIYIPLHVGRALSGDLGYQGDDSGENISDLNPFYGELTGYYWLWQNAAFDGNIGICHYRRFFIDEHGHILKERDFDEILSEYDIITSQAITEEMPYREYYAQAHNVADLDLEGEVIKKLYPEYYDSFVKVMSGKTHYFGNLLVTRKQLFDEYCEWLFAIFAELGELVDLTGYDAYHRRLFGFLSEQLLMVWVQAKGLKVYEGRVGLFDEKAETKELKCAVALLIKDKRFSEARELFYGVLKQRPDIGLEHSDIKGEIPVIAKVLSLLLDEQSVGYDELIKHTDDVNKLIEIVKEKY